MQFGHGAEWPIGEVHFKCSLGRQMFLFVRSHIRPSASTILTRSSLARLPALRACAFLLPGRCLFGRPSCLPQVCHWPAGLQTRQRASERSCVNCVVAPAPLCPLQLQLFACSTSLPRPQYHQPQSKRLATPTNQTLQRPTSASHFTSLRSRYREARDAGIRVKLSTDPVVNREQRRMLAGHRVLVARAMR